MSRLLAASMTRLRLLLTVGVGGGLLLMLAPQVNAPTAVLVAALAVALAAVALRNGDGVRVVLTEVASRPGTTKGRPARRVGHVTDPVHHPLRPRAPGLV